MQGIILETMAINTLISKNTSTSSYFRISYITILYLALNILFFEKANVSKFLEKFENMFDEY